MRIKSSSVTPPPSGSSQPATASQPAHAPEPPASGPRDDWRAQAKSKANALSPALPRAAVGLARDPEVAESFVRRFNAQEGLSGARLQGKVEGMREDALAFFQATPALFHADLGGAFADKRALLGRPAPRIAIDGDPHLFNFGTYRGADGHAVWGLNDFDQAGPGSPEADLERLSTSTVLLARQMGLSPGAQQHLVEQIGEHYFATIADLAGGHEQAQAPLSLAEARGVVLDVLAKADGAKRKDFLEKLTEGSEKKGYRFLQNEELKPVPPERAAAIEAALASYQKGVAGPAAAALPLKVLDLTEKLGSGGSSFGLNRYYALVANADPSKKPVVLEIKQLLPPSVEKQDADLSRSDGRQVVANQRALGSAINPLTGAATLDGDAYLVRELEPEKARVKSDGLSKEELESLAEQAAEVLARSHAAVPGQAEALEAWVKDDAREAIHNLQDFSKRYADQAEADWAAFVAATESDS